MAATEEEASEATLTSAPSPPNGVQKEAQSGQLAGSRADHNVNEEMNLITKSLEDLLGELDFLKREATGRLSNIKNRVSTSDHERIRQTKVSRFVLTRVAELESESLSMRNELARLFEHQKSRQAGQKEEAGQLYFAAEPKQEDLEFDEPTTTTTTTPSSQSEGMPATTLKPEEEAAKIGFDMEALKKLGEEIGKRLDQFGKEAAKNIGDLIEGVKLVFREPNSGPKAGALADQSNPLYSATSPLLDP